VFSSGETLIAYSADPPRLLLESSGQGTYGIRSPERYP
jgi:hypothetical protein